VWNVLCAKMLSMSFSLSEYTKHDVIWGFAPDPTGGAYTVIPRPLTGFEGAALRQDEDAGRQGKTSRGGVLVVEREGRGEGRGKELDAGQFFGPDPTGRPV